jgi:hypothetical protein
MFSFVTRRVCYKGFRRDFPTIFGFPDWHERTRLEAPGLQSTKHQGGGGAQVPHPRVREGLRGLLLLFVGASQLQEQKRARAVPRAAPPPPAPRPRPPPPPRALFVVCAAVRCDSIKAIKELTKGTELHLDLRSRIPHWGLGVLGSGPGPWKRIGCALQPAATRSPNPTALRTALSPLAIPPAPSENPLDCTKPEITTIAIINSSNGSNKTSPLGRACRSQHDIIANNRANCPQ